MSTRLRVACAVLCLVLGATAAVVATDLLRWSNRMRSDDARFAVVPEETDLWKLPALAPAGAAKALLGLDDDLAIRRAAQAFVLGRPRRESYTDSALIAQRARAEVLLGNVVASDASPEARADAANLLGVLDFASAVLDPTQSVTYFSGASASFRQAVTLDPNETDAKYNLELALERLRAARQSAGNQSQAPQGGIGSGSGARRAGSGY